MKSTVRNQFSGTVEAVELAPVSAQVLIAMPGGEKIVATMTRTAAERLQLRPGAAAMALIKASAIALVTDFDGYQLSARNQFAGRISRLERGAVSSLVVVTLASGVSFTATVTNDAVDALSLTPGAAATVVFKAYAVMVAARPAA